MKPDSHYAVTAAAFDVIHDLNSTLPILSQKSNVAEASKATDSREDMEFVDVESASGWATGGTGRDNPHADEWSIPSWSEDQARKKPWGYNVTCFNHFIDIRKGTGLFDDYDGYSYNKGSARLNQYQAVSDYLANDASSEAGGMAGLVGGILRRADRPTNKVDECLNWFFNDEYVHAPGHPWYQNHICSPAIERYSFFEDKAIYNSLTTEATARFPLAESTGTANKGIPYSVFMPVDNLARFWYKYYTLNRDPASLGPVMHAIQDASVPHHAAGCCGNWHSRYELALHNQLGGWLSDKSKANRFLTEWNWVDPNPPTRLAPIDWQRQPAWNWRIDMLVTWVALNAYKAYAEVYRGFQTGFTFNQASALDLLQMALAMSALVLMRAVGYRPIPIMVQMPDVPLTPIR
jgi:hypothetical protein